MAVGVIGVIMLLILPVPKMLLDLLLAISLVSSVLILMTAVMMKRPLDFAIFPTVLLVSTLFRLGLNLASTRLILTHGQEGHDAAGQVINAFGQLMMGGNFIIGVIIFAIILVVNFVVITKGSTRIAEVSARFTLDSMPGKQMAIDADLSSGLITEDQAKIRRKELEQESTFFGAMDGASKFVRGDAVAGLIITFINVIGGILIGTLQHKMALPDAANTYVQLTIGDGLVTQVPAIIISIAAGFLVSKAGVEGTADKALVTQLATNPVSLGVVSGAAGLIGLIPGMPLIPFAALAIGSGFMAWRLGRNRLRPQPTEAERAAAETAAKPKEDVEEPIANILTIDEVKIELGYSLLSLINDLEGRRLTDQIRALRRSLAQEYGFVIPQVRILDNMRLPTQGYAIRIKEMESGAGEVRLGHLMAMDPSGRQVELPGEHMREPAFGLPATWIEEGLREEATFRGYTLVDPSTVLTTHLTEILKENMADLLSYAEVQKLLKDLGAEEKKLVEELVPSVVTVTHAATGASGPAAREGVDPRPARHSGRSGRGRAAQRVRHHPGRTRPRAPGPPAVLAEQGRGGGAAHRHPVARVGGRLRRKPDRQWRGQATGHGPIAPAGFHPRRARHLRTHRHDGREPGPADRPDDPPLCPLHHRTLPGPDGGHEPERNPPQGAVAHAGSGLRRLSDKN